MHLRILAWLLVAGLSGSFARPLVSAPSTASNATAEFPNPRLDPFYAPPANLSAYETGQIIQTRRVNTTIVSDHLASSYQLFYRTTDAIGGAEATVATVWEPKEPKSPAQVLSYHVYMDSASFDCTPSWALVDGSASNGRVSLALDAPVFVKWALSKGIYAVVPDHEGPKAALIAGYQEGPATLDGMRAIRNFYTLPAETGFGMAGYSGGAHVTAWAANLAETYAPDVNIIGATWGGMPPDLRSLTEYLNKGLFAGFVGAGLVGLSSAYPELHDYLLENLTDEGKTQFARYTTKDFCIIEVVTSNPLKDILSLINVTNPLDQEVIHRTLAKESLFMSVSSETISVPNFPRMIYHGLLDEIVPYADEVKYIKEQCQHGADIQFQTIPVAEHIVGEVLGLPGAVHFLGQVFDGKVPPVLCGTSLPDFITLLDPRANDVLGQDTVKSLLGLNGTKSALGETINLPSQDAFES